MKITKSDILERAVVETLEHRQMLSTVAFNNGVLTVTGLPDATNNLQVRDHGSGKLQTLVNGKKRLFDISSVKTIEIVGGARSDFVRVDQKLTIPVKVNGLAGNDVIVTSGGSDSIIAGAGNDRVYVGGGNDRVTLSTGNDKVYGGAGHDTITSGTGQDSLYGGTGDDLFKNVNTTDSVYGGAGRDTMTFAAASTSSTPSVSGVSTNSKITVSSFTLIDAVLNKPVAGYDSIKDGAVLDLNTLPKEINIRANLSGGRTTVRFDLNNITNYRTEAARPYALAGDQKNGDYLAWTPTQNSNTLTANAVVNGAIVSSNTIHFTIIPLATTGATNPGTTVDPVTPVTSTTPDVPVTPVVPDATAPVAKITAIATTVPAGQAIHVQALQSALNSGSYAEADYIWNFGETASKYNNIKGFNASHVYDKPGTYNITLKVVNKDGKSDTTTLQVTIAESNRKVIYVSADGSDSNTGLSETQALRTIDKASKLVTDNTEILFHRGDQFNTAATIYISKSNVVLGAYGIGDRPIISWNGARNDSTIITTLANAQNVTIQDLTLDSIFNQDTNDTGTPFGLSVGGTNITVRRNQFLNLQYGVNANLQPEGMSMIDNTAPLQTGIRKYFAWIEGQDIVLIGNSCANSTREHVVRMNLCSRVLIAYNDLTNIDRTAEGDIYDIRKSALNIQSGEFCYALDNKLDGPMNIGPLGRTTDISYPNRRFKYVIAEGNEITNDNIHVYHGAEHITIRDNVIHLDSDTAIDVDGYNTTYQRGVVDLFVENNTIYNNGTQGNFIAVRGAVDGIRLNDNLYVAPNIVIGGYATAPVYVKDSDLKSFTSIDGNIWPVGAKSLIWLGERSVNIVGISTNDVTSYQTAAEWNNMDKVGDDIFTNVTNVVNNAATVNGHTAGVKLAA